MHANAKYVSEGALGYINAEEFYKEVRDTRKLILKTDAGDKVLAMKDLQSESNIDNVLTFRKLIMLDIHVIS